MMALVQIIIICIDSTLESPTLPCLPVDIVPKTVSSPHTSRALKSRVDARVAARYRFRVSAPTPRRVDRLPALHEVPRHAGSLWEHWQWCG